MMYVMNGFFIAHFLEPQPDGVRGREHDGRLHVTFAADFYTSVTAAELLAELDGLMHELPAVRSRVLYTDYFGAANDIEVRGLEPTPELLRLHFRLADRIQDIPGSHFVQPAYTGFGYRPHITVFDGEPQVGAEITVNTLTMWQILEDGSRVAIRTWTLGGA